MAELTEEDLLDALEEEQAPAEDSTLQPVGQEPIAEEAEVAEFVQWDEYRNNPDYPKLSPAQKQNLFDDWQNYASQYLAKSDALSTEDDVKYTEDYFTKIAENENLRKPIFNAPNYVEQLAQQAQSGFGAMEAGTAGYASALGMTDTATASDVIAQKYREQRDNYLNPDLKKFTEEKVGFFETAGKILTNPFDIAFPLFTQSMASSAPAIALGAGAGAVGTLAGGPIGGIGAGLVVGGAASGVVDGVITFNQMVIEEVGKRGLDPANAKDVQVVLDDPKFVLDAVDYSAARGVVIGATELATFGAGKYVGTAIRGVNAAGKAAKISGPKKLGIAAAVTGVETIGEGAGETGAQIAAPLATGRPVELQPGEIAAEMFVQAPGSAVQGALQTARVLLDANAPSSASEVTREAVQAAAEGKFEKVLGVQPSVATPTDTQKYYDGLSIADKARVLGMAPNVVLTQEQGTYSSLSEEEKTRVQVDFETETKAQQGPTVEEAEAKAREAFQPAPVVEAPAPTETPVAEAPVPAVEAPAPVAETPVPAPVQPLDGKPITEQETAPLEQVAPASAQAVAEEPAPVAEAPAPVAVVEAEAPAPTQTLPRNLAGAKPRYAFGAKQFALNFANDVDRALYIVAQTTKSAKDADYLNFAMKATGITEGQARAAGRAIRASIKEQARTSDADTLEVEQSDVTKPKVEVPVAVSATAPQAVTPAPVVETLAPTPRPDLVQRETPLNDTKDIFNFKSQLKDVKTETDTFTAAGVTIDRVTLRHTPTGAKLTFSAYKSPVDGKIKNISVGRMDTPAENRKKGGATTLLKELKAYADSVNLPIYSGRLSKEAKSIFDKEGFRVGVTPYDFPLGEKRNGYFPEEFANMVYDPKPVAPAPVTPVTQKLPPTKKQVTALTKLGYLPADIEALDRNQAKDTLAQKKPKVEAPKETPQAPAPAEAVTPAIPPAPVSEPTAPKAEERAVGEVSAPVAPPAGEPTATQTAEERLTEAEQKLQAKVGQVIAEADKLGVDEESVKAWLGPTPSEEKVLRTRAVLRLLNLGLADVYNNIRKVAAKTRGRQAEITEEGGPKIKRVVFTTREEGAGLLSNPEDMNALDVIYVNPDRLLSRLRADVTTDAADFFVKVLEEELLHVQHGRAAFDLFAGTVPEDQVTPENFKNFFRRQSEEIEDSLTLGQIQEVVGKYAGINTRGKTKEQLIQEFAKMADRRGRLAEEYLRTLIQRRMLGDITEDKIRGLTPNSILRSLGMIKNWLGKFVGETIPKKYANQTPVERYYTAVSDLIYGNTFAKIREARDEQGTAIPGKETLSASTDPMAVRKRFEQTTYQKELAKKIDEDFGLGKPKDAQKGEIWAKTVGLLIGKFPTFKPDEVQSIVGSEIPDAVKFFDPNRGVLFTTYLYQRGWRSLLDARKKQRRTRIYESGRTDVAGSVERARFQPLSEEIKKAEKPKNVTAEAKAEEIASEFESQENAAEEAANNIVARDADAVVQKYAEVAGRQAEEDQSFEEMMGPKTVSSELTASGFSPSQAAARDDLSKVFDQIFASFPQEVLPNGETASREQDVFDFLFRANEMENPPTRKGIMEKYNLGHSRQYDRIVESVREKVANTLAENNIFSAGQLSASIDPLGFPVIGKLDSNSPVRLSKLYDEFFNSRDLKEIMQNIADETTPVEKPYKDLAKYIVDNPRWDWIFKSGETSISPANTIAEYQKLYPGSTKFTVKENQRLESETLAFYLAKPDRIFLNKNLLIADYLRNYGYSADDTESKRNFNNDLASTFLHEFIHKGTSRIVHIHEAVQNAILVDGGYSYRSRDKRYFSRATPNRGDSLLDVLNKPSVQAKLTKGKNKIDELNNLLSDYGPLQTFLVLDKVEDIKSLYAQVLSSVSVKDKQKFSYELSDFDEFMAQAFNNPRFQSFLASIQVEGGPTAFEKLKKFIKELFELISKGAPAIYTAKEFAEESMLAKVLQEVSNLIELQPGQARILKETKLAQSVVSQLSASIDPIFYSKINRTVEESKQGRASGAQWKAMIKNSKLGVSLGEMGLVGVDALEDDKVYAKQEILDYLNANSIEADVVRFEGKDTKFSGYQIDEFGEDYSEVFVTQKEKQSAEKDFLIETYRDAIRLAEERGESQQVLSDLVLTLNETLSEKNLINPFSWRDGHSDYSTVKNPIVRVRFSVRTTSNGKSMLFIEEIQPPNDENQGLMPPLLIKNWRQIGMKWAIREATDRGLDLIGWTPGKTQVQRYSIAKQIKSIEILAPVSRNEKYVDLKGSDGVTFSLTVDPKGLITSSSGNAPQAKGQLLKDVIGEPLAKEVLKSNTGTIDGKNLEVGGEGLKKLYDEDLRNVVNGLPVVKKLGDRVDQSVLNTEKSLVDDYLKSPEYRELYNSQTREIAVAEKKRNDNLRYIDKYLSNINYDKRTQETMDAYNAEYTRTIEEFDSKMDELDASFRETSNGLFSKFIQGKNEPSSSLKVASLELTPEIKASVVRGQPLISASVDPMATQALRRSLLYVPEAISNLLKARTYFPYENKELLQKANDFVDANAGENDIFQAKIALDRASETQVSNPQRIITLAVIGKRLQDAVYGLDQQIKKSGNTPELSALRGKYSNDLYDILSVAQDILSASGQDLQAGRVFANLFTPEQMVNVYTKPIKDAQKKLLAANAEIIRLRALIQVLKNELATKAVGKGIGIIATPGPEDKFYEFLALFGDLEPNEQESFQEYLTRIGIDYPALMAELETKITASVDPITKASPLPKDLRNLNAREAVRQLVGLDKNFFSKLVNLRIKTGAVATTAEVASAQINKGRSQVSRKSRPIELQTVFDFFNTTESEKPTSEEPIEKDSLPLMVRLAKYASDSVTDRVLKSLGMDKKTTPKGLFDSMERQVRKYVNAQFREEMDPKKTAIEDTRTPEQKLTDLVERIGLAEQIFNQTKANLQARLDEDTRLRTAKVEGQMSDADRTALQAAVNRTFDVGKIVATANEVRQLVDFKAEARKHISQRGATVGSLSRLIKEKLPNLNDAQTKALADLITANYNRLVKDSGASQLNNILKRSLTKASKQPKKEIDQMLELMNIGAFDEEKFYNAISERFDLPAWDDAVVAEIRKRGEAVERLPQGSDQRTVAGLQLQAFIAQNLKEQAKGYAKAGYVMDVVSSLWKAGVLSGFGTQSVNLLSTGGNVGLELLTSAIGYAAALNVDNKIRANPGRFMYDILMTYLDNLGRVAPQEAMDAFATGFGRLRSENQKQITALEAFSIDSKLPKNAKSVAKWSLNNYLALAKLVGRAMAAADTFNANIANEAKMRMQMRYLLMSQKNMSPKETNETMKNLFSANSDMINGIREQVDREAAADQFGTLDGLEPKSLAYQVQNRKIEAGKRRRIAQLREQVIAVEVAGDNADEVVKGIRNFTEIATFNNNPTGALGLVGDTIAIIGNKFKLAAPFTSFTRTVANVVNASLNYTPYGYARAAGFSLGNLFGNMGGKYEFKGPEGVEFYKLQAQATMGTLSLLALASLFWKDMEDPWDKAEFAVTGLGPSDPNKRAQLRASGWAENSVKITTPFGPLQFRHSDIPGLSLVLGGLGMLSDSIRYGSLKEADKTTLAAYMAASLGSVVFEKNLLSGAKSLFDILKLKEDPVAALQKGAGQYVGGITNPGLFKWLAQTVGVNERGMVEQIEYRKLNSTVPGFLLGLTPVAIKVGSPRLNRLGEPVEEYPWAASTKRIGFFPEVKPHPVLSPLVGANLFVPGISRLTTINVYRKGRPEQVRVDVTEDTYYDYAKYNGQYLKRLLTPARAKILANRAKTDREGAQEELQDLARQAKKYAVDRIEAQIRTKGLGQ